MLNSQGKFFMVSTDTSPLKNINGGNTGSFSMSSFKGNQKLVVGSGTTAPTIQDYAIESPVSLDLISNTFSIAPSTSSNYMETIQSTFKNNGNTDVTVSEVGLYVDGNGEWSGTHTAMVAREVIPPVTIAPGKTYTFSMTIG